MKPTLEGGCACGEVRYRLASRPMFVHCCHCRDCQRQTGSAFVINALIETSRVDKLSGETRRSPLRPIAVGRMTFIAAQPAEPRSGAITGVVGRSRSSASARSTTRRSFRP